MSLPLDERETALVIDHYARAFHISTSKVSYISQLRKIADRCGFPAPDTDDGDTLSYSNVPTAHLAQLSIATYAK